MAIGRTVSSINRLRLLTTQPPRDAHPRRCPRCGPGGGAAALCLARKVIAPARLHHRRSGTAGRAGGARVRDRPSRGYRAGRAAGALPAGILHRRLGRIGAACGGLCRAHGVPGGDAPAARGADARPYRRQPGAVPGPRARRDPRRPELDGAKAAHPLQLHLGGLLRGRPRAGRDAGGPPGGGGGGRGAAAGQAAGRGVAGGVRGWWA